MAKLLVTGMDPSMNNWGLAKGMLDTETGVLENLEIGIIQPKEEPKGKQVRQNSYDIEVSAELYAGCWHWAITSRYCFVEVPHGSQSASAMKGYGMCIGVLGSLRAAGLTIIEVSEAENKKAFCGDRKATKEMMIATAHNWYPNANWPLHNGKLVKGRAEHMADAIGAIHAGVLTQEFQRVLALIKE